MRKALVTILAVVGASAIALALVGVVIVACTGKGSVPKRTVLELNLEHGLAESAPDHPFARMLGHAKPTVRDLVEGLERARDDARVTAVVARVGAAPMGVAQIQEIRDAVIAFRTSHKPAVVFSETFGEFGPGSGAYYLATAFDEIWLQPSGDVGLTGLWAEAPFIAGTFEKLGIRFRGDHRKEYKNALNMLTEKKFTPAHREATEKMVTSLFGQLANGIAAGRKLSPEEVRALVDRAPLTAKEALAARLVDGLAYRDEVYDQVKKRGGKNAKLLYLGPYLERAGRPHEQGKTIALIYGVGAVQRGKSRYDPLSGEAAMGSDTVAGAFRAAIADKDVKAILFRIDSPGGSYVASDAIWRETVRAKQAGKPVIVSMGDVAGSGGYFVAMSADKIVAQPGTITASIGVLGGKLLTGGLWDRVGLSFDEVHAGQNAGMWSGTRDYSPAEWARFQTWLDRVYEDFTGKVAEGRRLPKDRVLEIAKGRIWTGEDAKALGLVDELGGYPAALKLAREAAGLKADAKVKLQVFPARRSALDALLEREGESSERDADAEVAARALETLRPALQRLEAATGEREVLRMPEVTVR